MTSILALVLWFSLIPLACWLDSRSKGSERGYKAPLPPSRTELDT